MWDGLWSPAVLLQQRQRMRYLYMQQCWEHIQMISSTVAAVMRTEAQYGSSSYIGFFETWQILRLVNLTFDKEVAEVCNKSLKLLLEEFGTEGTWGGSRPEMFLKYDGSSNLLLMSVSESLQALGVDFIHGISLPQLDELRIGHLTTVGSEYSSGLAGYDKKLLEELSFETRGTLSLFKEFKASDFFSAQKIRRRAMYFPHASFQDRGRHCNSNHWHNGTTDFTRCAVRWRE